MNARTTQYLIGAVFAVLGGWALVAPESVIALTIRPEFHSEDFLATFAIACFGAQACLFALVAFTARFTRRTFAAYGLALIPFFAFNGYFYFVVPLFTTVGLLDFIGNLVMLGLCWHGWRVAEA
ncbi:MAG: hypothetical protein ACTS1X_01970 [Parasphingopyxis sp.]|uniref:hypothetical protein n=1 Tax=Parasphingopyxis sp. TaxID=1920299 RepID=UPI003F9F1BFA